MDDLSHFFLPSAPEQRIPTGRGGARPGAGAKKGRPANRPAPANATTNLTDYQRKERAAADKEEDLARQARVKADLEEGSVVPRQMVRDAQAQAFSACAQSLDSIGDMLEAEGFEVNLCERVVALVNAAKQKLADDLEAMHKGAEDDRDD